MLSEKHPATVQEIFSRYPEERKRSAVMPLLHLAQQEYGFVSAPALQEVADLCGLETTQVASIVGFYTLYYDHPEGKHRIQICTDLPCALRGADAFADHVCQHLGVKMGGTTPDGRFTVEPVTCLAACDKAPMFQLQNKDGIAYYENQTVESAMKLVEELRKG